MRNTKTSTVPAVDIMEPKLLLSTAGPLISRQALTGVVREVKAIVSTLGKTENTPEASAQLTGLALQIPSGSRGPAASTGLALSWQSDIELYRPHSKRSLITTQKRLLNDLNLYIQLGGNGGNSPVSGSGTNTPTTPGYGAGGTTTPTPTPNPGHGTTGVPNPSPELSLDSVQIENTTGMALLVTVQLETPLPQQPTITQTISAQPNSIATFNFGTSTGDFMMMDVSRAGGGATPPPFDNINLSQPMSGYNGTVFTISVFSSYFSVNIPT